MRLRRITEVAALSVLAGISYAAAGADGEVSRASSASFQQMAQVLRSPRCMNCHTVTEFPRQADDRHRHHQMIMRGQDNKGAATLQCFACHQAKNTSDGQVPGAPNWHLAPLSMGWEGLSDRALCRVILDKNRNGNKDVAALVEHMTADPLVQWAWSPGGRTLPPLAQKEFHDAVRAWADQGAACPK